MSAGRNQGSTAAIRARIIGTQSRFRWLFSCRIASTSRFDGVLTTNDLRFNHTRLGLIAEFREDGLRVHAHRAVRLMSIPLLIDPLRVYRVELSPESLIRSNLPQPPCVIVPTVQRVLDLHEV